MSRTNGLEEMRQRAFELRRADRAAAKLAELLELAGRRKDYDAVRDLQRRLLADLFVIDEVLGAHQ